MTLLRKIAAVLAAVLCLTLSAAAWASPFIPDEPIIKVSQLKRGMKGYAKTAVPGNKIVSFPVEVLDVVTSPTRPRHLVLLRASGDVIKKLGGIAAGMSGSPVYFGGKLAGAIGYNWSFSDHDLTEMTPIEEMMSVFDYPESDMAGPLGKKPLAGPLTVSGLSSRALQRLSSRLGVSVQAGLSGSEVKGAATNVRLRPGDPISVLLAWGDVDVEETGTVSAVSRDGRFLAFGHEVKNFGAVRLPVSTAKIHHIIPSMDVPFKLASPGQLIGTATQDRIEGVGGWFGRFSPAMSVSIRLKDKSQNLNVFRRFQMAPIPALLPTLLPDVLAGVIDSELNRVGPGTAKITLSLNGKNFYPGWKWDDVIADSQSMSDLLASRVTALVDAVSQNPFSDLHPLGVTLDVDVTPETNVLYLEKVEVKPETAAPGERVTVSVTMRPRRGKPTVKKFDFVVPEDWEGSCTVLARGGQLDNEAADSGSEGSSRPSSLKEFLADLTDAERSCEVIVSLEGDETPSDKSAQEIRRTKMSEGTMRVFRSEYSVDGSLSVPLVIGPKGK
ncbi:SpoIVB peptidase S55 [Jonquetella anthropi DSM 22815]|uniref:SpoIVB peptidase S55 n=1 Tax=Jonquetella anthropi DSM 22815 TaxID=885272 RepID=H0UL53_9BACT|nr:SpoIVB peptidase S55 domain-containing protein [Jonquetella anthropi]EHM13412.1 SpoIVB peptidase S55 [Jonquetella anthropi DSM 22815]